MTDAEITVWPSASILPAVCRQDLSGIYPGFIRDLSGIYLGFIRDSSGIYPGFIRDLSGIYLGFIRDLSGSYLGFNFYFAEGSRLLDRGKLGTSSPSVNF